MVQNLSQPVIASCSNQTWCLSFSPLDMVIEDENGTRLGRPLLTVLCDVYASVVSGYHLDLGEPNPLIAIAALRHAILRKNYPLEDGLLGDGAVYGVPEMLIVDASKLWTSSTAEPLHHLLEKFGITLVQLMASRLRLLPSELISLTRIVRTDLRKSSISFPALTNSASSWRTFS